MNLRAMGSCAEVDDMTYILDGQMINDTSDRCSKCKSEEGKDMRRMEHKDFSWIVLRTFNRHERLLSEFLKEKGLTCFVPMRYKERLAGGNGKPKQLIPVIHDYVFLENTLTKEHLEGLLSKCPTPLYVLKSKETDCPFEIPSREMAEFRLLCDPDFEGLIEFSLNDDIKVGKEVEIVHGPFSGVRGRLYRKQKQYWFVKTLAGLSVELRITRWYCKPIDEKEN